MKCFWIFFIEYVIDWDQPSNSCDFSICMAPTQQGSVFNAMYAVLHCTVFVTH